MQSLALIIPLKNEELSVSLLLDSIHRQSLQPAAVILVDGGSTDRTVARLKELTKDDKRFRIIEAGNAMPGTGRNIGAEGTDAEWLAFTDAGIRLDQHWLEKLVDASMKDPAVGIVYGNYTPEVHRFFERCAAIAYVPPLRPGKIRSKFIASSIVKKSVWQKAGGFPDWRASEDLIFIEKAEATGTTTASAPEAMVYWQLRQGLGSTFRRFESYSKYNVLAGRQRYWHYGVARQYILVAATLVLGFTHSPYWLLFLPAWLMARAGKRMFAHRHQFGWKTTLNPLVFIEVMIILLVIDMATFSGWTRALAHKPVTSNTQH